MDNEDLLDLFAGLALVGLLSSGGDFSAAAYAEDAYDLADAMMEEREKRLERKKNRPAQSN
jgi:hypothetical protein